jgi:hypothetical protein
MRIKLMSFPRNEGLIHSLEGGVASFIDPSEEVAV